MNKKFTIISLVIVGVIISAAVLYSGNNNTGTNQQTVPSVQTATPATEDEIKTSLPEFGSLGSDHSHISLVLFVNDEQVDLSQFKYMLKDRLVHLENNDGVVIHKHATGVTVPYYLSTLGIKIAQNCLTLDTNEQYCDSDAEKLRLVANGSEIENFASYEMKQDDRILVNYGSGDQEILQSRFNQVPSLPEEFSSSAL